MIVRPNRWSKHVGLWLVLIAVLGAGVFVAFHGFPIRRIRVSQQESSFPADGRRHPVLSIVLRGYGRLSAAEFRSSGPKLELIQRGEKALAGFLQSPILPGDAKVQISGFGRHFNLPVKFVLEPSDSYGDGTPDFLRLHSPEDRQDFRRWFTLLAEMQAEQPKEKLPSEIDDCAALLRYAYREALHGHDESWLEEHVAAGITPPPSIRQYRYPQTPLGASLFRVKPGPFTADDLKNGSFAQFADARSLMEFNTHLVSRNIRSAMRGDLLFYRQLEQNSPYHSMIVSGDKAEWVIYHTGPIGHAKGEMRRVSMGDLLRHPDARWRPVPENTNFLGVYRWNILREGD